MTVHKPNSFAIHTYTALNGLILCMVKCSHAKTARAVKMVETGLS